MNTHKTRKKKNQDTNMLINPNNEQLVRSESNNTEVDENEMFYDQTEKQPLYKSNQQSLLAKLKKHPLWKFETGLILAAVGFGLLSGLANQMNIQATKNRLQSFYQTSNVIVASRDIRSGEIIDPSMVQTGLVLKKYTSSNMISPSDLDLIVGKKIMINIKEGDPILLSTLIGSSESTNLSEKIPPGKRLFTLTINDQAASLGFIKPNDRVDILAHLNIANRGMTTFTVLQDITLISVGASTILDASGRPTGTTVSFFVDAKDVEMLSFAQKQGEFSLSLRNPKDVGSKFVSKGIDLNDFLDYKGVQEVTGGSELKILERKTTNDN